MPSGFPWTKKAPFFGLVPPHCSRPPPRVKGTRLWLVEFEGEALPKKFKKGSNPLGNKQPGVVRGSNGDMLKHQYESCAMAQGYSRGSWSFFLANLVVVKTFAKVTGCFQPWYRNHICLLCTQPTCKPFACFASVRQRSCEGPRAKTIHRGPILPALAGKSLPVVLVPRDQLRDPGPTRLFRAGGGMFRAIRTVSETFLAEMRWELSEIMGQRAP